MKNHLETESVFMGGESSMWEESDSGWVDARKASFDGQVRKR